MRRLVASLATLAAAAGFAAAPAVAHAAPSQQPRQVFGCGDSVRDWAGFSRNATYRGSGGGDFVVVRIQGSRASVFTDEGTTAGFYFHSSFGRSISWGQVFSRASMYAPNCTGFGNFQRVSSATLRVDMPGFRNDVVMRVYRVG
jgi:hypothetical protein